MSWMSVSPHTWRLACVRDMVRPVVLRHVGRPRPERAGGVRPEDVSTLDQNAAWLKANPGTLLLIEGHTDERGTSEYNLGLGDLRASAAQASRLASSGRPAFDPDQGHEGNALEIVVLVLVGLGPCHPDEALVALRRSAK